MTPETQLGVTLVTAAVVVATAGLSWWLDSHDVRAGRPGAVRRRRFALDAVLVAGMALVWAVNSLPVAAVLGLLALYVVAMLVREWWLAARKAKAIA